jgi:acetyl esterase/lipase
MIMFAHFSDLGWVVGSHEVEEVENRMLAAKGGAVVASVDYRMAPEYKFPYAVNDCFDALKWVILAYLPNQQKL